MSTKPKIAVIGGGIAGITASHLLQKKYEVTIFEAAPRLGGHAASIENNGVVLDTAFLIFNELTYPTFMKLVDALDIRSSVQKCEMSASFVNTEKDFQYALLKGLGEVSTKRKISSNLDFTDFSGSFTSFGKVPTLSDLTEGRLGSKTLGHYLADYSELFREELVLPLTMAIWSIPADRVWEYPAQSILRFFLNHRLLKGSSGDGWRSFAGSSRKYVAAFESQFAGTICRSDPVMRVKRFDRKVLVKTAHDEREFDQLVIALHADDALAILDAPTDRETELLGAWTYFDNQVVLHTDVALMPQSPQLWSSWNVRQSAQQRSVTYHLNRVQKLDCKENYFLTLGDCTADKKSELGRFHYRHPIYTWKSVGTQKALTRLQGMNRSYYCGSYFGHGFHEDAASSGSDVAKLLGCDFTD